MVLSPNDLLNELESKHENFSAQLEAIIDIALINNWNGTGQVKIHVGPELERLNGPSKKKLFEKYEKEGWKITDSTYFGGQHLFFNYVEKKEDKKKEQEVK